MNVTDPAVEMLRIFGNNMAQAATDFEKLATSILTKEKPRMKLHPEALTRTGRRHPLHNTIKTAKQIRKESAAEVAQSRGLAPDARTYFRAVQTVKAEYLRRTAEAE